MVTVTIFLALAALASGDAAAAGRAGERDYATYCAPCHGPRGWGDGPLATMLVPRPARHSDPAFMNALSDEYLLRLLQRGGPALGKSSLMGAWGRTLSEERLRDLVAFMRSLAGQGEFRGESKQQEGRAD
jgi:mono/diheme cytochrome c family protein